MDHFFGSGRVPGFFCDHTCYVKEGREGSLFSRLLTTFPLTEGNLSPCFHFLRLQGVYGIKLDEDLPKIYRHQVRTQ